MQQDLATNQLAEQQQILQRIAQVMIDGAGLGEVFGRIVAGAQEALHADGARLVLAIDGQLCARGAGAASRLMAPSDGVVFEQAADGPVRDMTVRVGPELGAAFAAPVVALGKHRGVLWVGYHSFYALADAERDFLGLLAAQAALILSHGLTLRAARRDRAWLEAALTSNPEPTLVVDQAGRLRLANQAARALWPMLGADAIGQPLDEHLAALWGLGGAATAEYAAGDGRNYAPVVSEFGREDGTRAGWVLMLRDMTRYKQLNASMTEFVSTVTHDMRSPLTFIKGYVDMLGSVGDLNEKQTKFVEKTLSGVVQMADMVEKILKAGKLDPVTGTYELEREPTDVAQLARAVVAALAEPAAKQGLTLTSDFDPAVPPLNVDPSMLESAFTNLAENAVKYTPEGGRVEVFLRLEEGRLIFGVTDDGYGIRPEDQAQLFQRNVRLHRKEWKRVKGSGLGLFIVKNVAQRHGGDAWVRSAEGDGSTFYLSIPLDGATLVAGHEPAS